jgi:hypothetical protein
LQGAIELFDTNKSTAGDAAFNAVFAEMAGKQAQLADLESQIAQKEKQVTRADVAMKQAEPAEWETATETEMTVYTQKENEFFQK